MQYLIVLVLEIEKYFFISPPADVRVIVDADQHLALATPHEVGHPLVVIEGEVDSVAGGLPFR